MFRNASLLMTPCPNHPRLLLGHTHHTGWGGIPKSTLFYHSPEVVAEAYPSYQGGEEFPAYQVLVASYPDPSLKIKSWYISSNYSFFYSIVF